ncbi:hypothetical protein [Burkholderia sp. BE17]|uniref:hypothetical protein n=1 Tax=Burkholderia sp. BE17 TaxID=2656644 RepID=UPI00128C0C8A|nr:hypothetical protein [Burkholderia sp. BE17]MPV64345.1 hypothetical protein [Burkholderia sp. BE17]
MRAYILTIALALSTSSSFAVSTCDSMPTKNQRMDCWSNLIGDYQREAEEYAFAVQESKKVPANVKHAVEEKHQAISNDANARCRKDELGYPENTCYIQQIQMFKDFTYKQTSKFGVPDKRLN